MANTGYDPVMSMREKLGISKNTGPSDNLPINAGVDPVAEMRESLGISTKANGAGRSSTATSKGTGNRFAKLGELYKDFTPEEKQRYASLAQRAIINDWQNYSAEYESLYKGFETEYGKQGYRSADAASKYAGDVTTRTAALYNRGRGYLELMDIFGDDIDPEFRDEITKMVEDTGAGMYQLRTAALQNKKYYGQFADENAYNLYLDYQAHPEKYTAEPQPVYTNFRGEEVDIEQEPQWKIKDDYEQAEAEVERLKQEKREYELDYQEWQRSFTAESRKYGADPETRASNPEYQQFVAEWDAEDARRQAEYDDYDARIAEAEARAKELDKEYDEAFKPFKYLNTINVVMQASKPLQPAGVTSLTPQGRELQHELESNPASDYTAELVYQAGGDPNSSAIGAGLLNILAPATDAVGYVGEVAGIEGATKWRDKAAEWGDTAARWNAQQKAGRNDVGEFVVDAAEQAVPLVFDAALNYATGGAAGLVSLGVRSFGGGTMEARQGGGNLLQQGLYGAGSAATEILTEKMFDAFGGKVYGASSMDDVINHWAGASFKSPAGRAVAKYVVDAAGEGVEEVVSDLVNPALKSIYNNRSVLENYSDLEFDEIAYDFAMGAALGALGGSVNVVAESAGIISERDAFFMEAGAKGVDFADAAREWKRIQLSKAKALGEGEIYDQALAFEKALDEGQRVSEKKIEKLNARAVKELSNADIANTMEAVQKRLAELGVSDPDLARAITAAALAPEAKRVGAKEIFMTAAQQKLIQNSPVAQQVLAEMNVNALRTEQIKQMFGAETDGTMDNSWAKTGIRGNRLLASDVYGTERAVSSPEIGKATVNGEDVQIVGVQDGKIRIKQGENISSVAVKDISNISDDYHTLLEAAASREDGDTMLRAYRPGQIISSYVQAWTLASELYGANTSLTPAQARDMYPSLFRTLTDTQLELAMKSGAKAAAAKTEKRNAEIKEAKKKASEEAETKGEVKRKKGTVSYDGGKVNGKTVKGVDKSKFTRQQKAISAMVETLADVVNIDYVFFDGDPNTGGAYTQGGKIYLNINSGLLANKALGAATLSHEITHFLQDYAPEEYNELKDFITSEILKKSPEEFNKLVERQLALEPNLSFTDVVNEVVANACQKMLLNSKAITELARQNMKLAEKIADVIEDISGKIKAAFADVDINDNIGVYAPARAIEGFVDEVQKRWDRALKAAVENYNAEQATDKKNTAENGGVQRQTFLGYDEETGRGIYESNFPENSPAPDKQRRVIELVQNVFSKKPIELLVDYKDGTSEVIEAQFDPDFDESGNRKTDLGKLAFGNRHGNKKEKRVTLNLADDYYHILQDARHIESQENYDDIAEVSDINQDVEIWHYFVNNILYKEQGKDDKTPYAIYIDIKKNPAGHFVYTFYAREEKNNGQTTPQRVAAAVNSSGIEAANGSPIDSVPQESQESNTQNQQNQKFSADELQAKHDSYIGTGKELTDVRNQIRTWKNTADYNRIMDDIGKAKGDAIQDAIQAYKEWEDASGFGALYEREKELSDRYDRLRKEYEAMSLENEKEIEREQMEKSGKSEGDFFRDKAVKEFGYTPYYYDAGYIVPNGKMLNFSGEKGKHYGSRGQDHRAIGTIFTGDISGSEAMLKFMGQGNIRIMAETPGVDISKDVEPTKEQYAQIRKFAAAYAKEEFFGVDFTDERGNTIGSLEYDGRVRPDRVINDIKHFYETGEVRDQGISQFYQKWGIGETEAEQQARAESFESIKAENKILRERADYWKAQTRVSKEHLINRKDTGRLANALIREYSSRADKDSVKEKLKELGDWLVQNKDISYDELREKAREIADEITSESYGVIDDSQTEQLSMLKDFLKSTPLNLSAEDFRDTGDENFRRRYGRYFTVRKNGRGIDSAWGELAAMFGEGLFPEDTYAPGDMLNIIGDYLDLWKPQYGNPLETYGDETLDYATNQIIEAMLSADIREAPKTFADKALEKLWRQQAKDKAKLDALREQKNARIEQLKREAAEKNKEIRLAEKAAKYKAVSKVKQHYQDMIKGQRARRSDTKIRGKIKDLHKELSNMLLKPTEKRYVPRDLVKATSEILEAIDTTTGKSTKASAAFAELRTKYDALAKDDHYAMVYDDAISDMLQNLADNIGEGSIYDLTGAQLESVYNTLRALKHTIQEANRLTGSEIEATAFEAANAMMNEANNAKGIKYKFLRKFVLTQATPETAFSIFGGYRKGSMWQQMYNMLNKGQLTQTQILMEGGQIFRELIDDKKNMATLHNRKKLVDIGLKDSDGNAIPVTRGMMLSVYMHLQNEQNARHVEYGGFTVPKLTEYYKGKMSDAFSGKTGRAVAFAEEMVDINKQIREAETQEEIDALNERMEELREESEAYMDNIRLKIEEQLNEYDRKWIEAAQKFFDVYSKNKLNEVTEMVYGFQKAQVNNYFPIHTDKDYRQASFDTIARDMSLENAGFMKERINGSNPILLEDITDVISNQLRRTAQYCGLMPAIRNFNKAYGKARAGYSDSVQKAISTTFGKEGQDYIEHLMADLNGARRSEANIFDELRGNMAGAALTLNPRVALAQTASFPTAAAELGYSPLIRALKDFGKNPMRRNAEAREEINKWTPLWWYRMQGFSTVELGDIKNNEQFMARVMDRFKWATGWIQFMDGETTGALWQASKYYVEDNFKDLEKGSDEYMMKVAEVYNRAIERTQPDYTTMQRPDILRNPNAIVKQLTMFMTQRLQNTNLLYDATARFATYARDFKAGRNGVTADDVKAARTKLIWATSSQIVSAATIVTFKFLADMLLHSMNGYRDDDKELTAESVSLALFKNFTETLASNVLWGSEVYSALRAIITGDRYYGISLNGVESFTDAVDAIVTTGQKTVQGKLTGKQVDKLAKALAQFFGIPYSNAEKIALAMANHVEDARNGTFMEAGVEWLSESKEKAWEENVKPLGITQREFKGMVAEMDSDGNGSVKQDEAGVYLTAAVEAGRLTQTQAASIWTVVTSGKTTYEEWAAKNK